VHVHETVSVHRTPSAFMHVTAVRIRVKLHYIKIQEVDNNDGSITTV